jgi:RluA family pseudouridine synthase
MATRRLTWRIGAAQQGMRLDRFLAAAFAEAVGRAVPRAQVDRLILRGRVLCDGRPERHGSFTLRAGNRVDAAFDPETLGAGRGAAVPQRQTSDTADAFVWTPERILFEDEWLVVVDKPAGLPTQPTLDASRPSVFGTLMDYLTRRDGGEIYLGLHHRLDRDTTGVLLFTKDRRANAATAALFSGKTAQKTYQALATEMPGPACPDSWRVENYLGAVGRVGKATKFGAVRSGGDPAQTSFRLLERLPGALLVEAQPHTGRTHQIRVHLAEGGNPIFGDELYGGPLRLRAAAGAPVAVPRTLLHAWRLEFPHPVNGAPVAVTSALPADFAECLRRLRAV